MPRTLDTLPAISQAFRAAANIRRAADAARYAAMDLPQDHSGRTAALVAARDLAIAAALADGGAREAALAFADQLDAVAARHSGQANAHRKHGRIANVTRCDDLAREARREAAEARRIAQPVPVEPIPA